MQHRHLDDERWNTATVASTLERGSAGDLLALFRELRRDPHGPTASAALRAAEHSEVYGYPQLVVACLDAWRQQTQTASAGSA